MEDQTLENSSSSSPAANTHAQNTHACENRHSILTYNDLHTRSYTFFFLSADISTRSSNNEREMDLLVLVAPGVVSLELVPFFKSSIGRFYPLAKNTTGFREEDDSLYQRLVYPSFPLLVPYLS
jgi:hypothetical protein